MSAKSKHTPTRAMQAAAKKGVSLIDGKNIKEGDISDLSLKAGKKLASGSQLSDDHVRAMEEYHQTHAGSCPTEGKSMAEDLLWGGPAGAMWSGTRVAAMDTAMLSDDEIDLDSLFASGAAFGFEVFGSTAGEKIEFDDDDDGLLWAPILRSGTLATRPGPNGQKLHDPLVFVPGHSADPRKEIGLEDLKDAFEAGAIQHVTIPTRHTNDVLENTGFIEAMKITDSTLRPGQKVLMGGHRFTEPEVRDKVKRGTIANRSCGILYDYTNTETGQTFGSVIEHVCLTNRPFVPGMEPYGATDELDFSELTIVPLLLSEPSKEAKSSGDSWDGSPSRFTDQQYKRSCLIDRKNGKSPKESCSLPVREPSGALNEKGVDAAAAMIGKVAGVSSEAKKSAAKKLVGFYKQFKKTPPPNIAKMAAVSTNMSEDELKRELQLADVAWGDGPSLNDIKAQLVELLRDMRQSPQDEYGGPTFFVEDVMANPYKARVCCDYGDYLSEQNEDNWVVPFSVDDAGKVELSDFAQWEPVKREWVVDEEDKTQSAELDTLLNTPPDKTSPTPIAKLSDDPVERAGQERLALSRESQISTHTTGGRSMSTLTRDSIGQMNLSDDVRAVLLREVDEREQEQAELNRLRGESRNDLIRTYLTELSDNKGLKGHPGLLREIERALLGDDGKPAARLDLSDDGGSKDQMVTITDVVKRIVDAMPLSETSPEKEEKGPLKPTLLESPIDGRPPIDRDKPEGEPDTKTLTGAQLAEKWKTDLGGHLDLPLADDPSQTPAPVAG